MTPIIYGPGPEAPPALRALPDLAGLPADDVRQQPLGSVAGVLTEADSGLIRYLDIGLDRGDRHVLVPIGHVRIEDHADGTRVRLRAATREDLDTVPPYVRGEDGVEERYESELLIAYSRLFYGEHYYAHPAYDHRRVFAGEHVVIPPEDAAPGPREAGLAPLASLSAWRVASGQPDVRGWQVRAADAAPLGRVADLIVDPSARRVRYLLVRTPDEEFVLIPIGYAALARAARRVELPTLRGPDFERLPRRSAEADAVTREEERELLERLNAAHAGARRFERPDFALPAAAAGE